MRIVKRESIRSQFLGKLTAKEGRTSEGRLRPDSKVILAPADQVMEVRRTSEMVNPVASAHQSEPVVNSAPSSQPASAKTTYTSSTPKETVQISTAAQSALQEIIETPVQTATEARSGDIQAQRLLAKETAAQKT